LAEYNSIFYIDISNTFRYIVLENNMLYTDDNTIVIPVNKGSWKINKFSNTKVMSIMKFLPFNIGRTLIKEEFGKIYVISEHVYVAEIAQIVTISGEKYIRILKKRRFGYKKLRELDEMFIHSHSDVNKNVRLDDSYTNSLEHLANNNLEIDIMQGRKIRVVRRWR
jgi:hypothetical protein